MTTADEVIRRLGLAPHPEGGHFREIHRSAAATSIYFLLKAGERSHWHRVDSDEIWNFHAGAPLDLALWPGKGLVQRHRLGTDLAAGERPQVIVAKNVWQSAVSRGDWTLVGCAVAPAFDFAGFELAPPGWEPNK